MGHGSTTGKPDTVLADLQLSVILPGAMLTTEERYVEVLGSPYIYSGLSATLISATAKQGQPDTGAEQAQFNVLINQTPALTTNKALEASANTPAAGTIDATNRSISDGDRVDFRIIQGTNADAQNLCVDLVLRPNT